MIKFEFSEGLPFIEGKVKQVLPKVVPIRFIIDTGSSGSAVDVNLVAPDLSRQSRFAKISGVGGGDYVLIQTIDVIQLGLLQIQDIEMQFGDLENSFGVQGIIGNNILEAYKANIDYKFLRLSLTCPVD